MKVNFQPWRPHWRKTEHLLSKAHTRSAGAQYKSIHHECRALCDHIESADAVTKKRVLLSSVSAAFLLRFIAAPQPAAATVTMTLKAKPQPKQYTLKAGYTVTVPDSWALAYDRSGSSELGTQVFFGNFRTYETLSIFKLEQPGGESDFDPQELLEIVLAEQKNNQSFYTFRLLSGPKPHARRPDIENEGPGRITYYDSEYELAVCRGLIQEGSGGRRRCVGPNDMDLQVVSRHFFQTFACDPSSKHIYVVRGSTTSDNWPQVGPAAVEAVQSFRLA